MKYLSCLLLLSAPLISQAWDGSGYGYKTGRYTKMTHDYSMSSSETIHYSTTQASPRIQEHDQTVFQRLGDSFTVDIPDPSEALQTIIETTPRYFW